MSREIVKHVNRWHWGESMTLISSRGVASMDIKFEDENPGVAYLTGLIVLDKFRRCGWASVLLKEAETECRLRGVFRMDLDAVKEPAFVAEFYERRGFRRIKDEDHTIFMTKFLKNE